MPDILVLCDFQSFGRAMGMHHFVPHRILAQGSIKSDSHTKLIAFLSDKKRHQHTLPPKPDLCFDSPGVTWLVRSHLVGPSESFALIPALRPVFPRYRRHGRQ